MNGAFRFLNRVWRFFAANIGAYDPNWRTALSECPPRPLEGEGQGEGVAGSSAEASAKADRNLRRKTHQTIQKVTSDIERFHFNTAVSTLMELVNEMADFAGREGEAPAEPPSARCREKLPRPPAGEGRGEGESAVLSEAMESLALLLGPFAPHMADELWERLGKKGTTYEQAWPQYDPAIAKAEEVTVVLQINGKVRDRIQVPVDTDRAELERLALESDRMKAFLDNKPIKKVVVVPGKLVNVVV